MSLKVMKALYDKRTEYKVLAAIDREQVRRWQLVDNLIVSYPNAPFCALVSTSCKRLNSTQEPGHVARDAGMLMLLRPSLPKIEYDETLTLVCGQKRSACER
jgi:hypothetical protein